MPELHNQLEMAMNILETVCEKKWWQDINIQEETDDV